MLRWWSAPAAGVAVAATNDTLAIAYVELSPDTGAPAEGRLILQLLDGNLDARGAAQEIDRQALDPGTRIASVATDGATFLICWSPTDQIRCIAANGSGGAALLFQTEGLVPTVAFHGTTWALAYAASTSGTAMSEARVIRISRQGAPLGDPATFPYYSYFSGPMSFVSTPSGFALLAGQPTLSLYRLTADLAVQGVPVATDLSPWQYRQLAATDEEAAMGLAVPYGNVLYHVRGAEVVLRQERGCDSKGGCDTAVAVQGGTFAVAWRSSSGQVSFFPDIDHAGTSQDVLAAFASSIVLVPFGSGLVVVSEDPPYSWPP